MATSSHVAVVFGVGPNVGMKVVQQFTSEGYEVAAISRSGKGTGSSKAALSITAELLDPRAVHGVYEVRANLGESSLVVYNGMRFWSIGEACCG